MFSDVQGTKAGRQLKGLVIKRNIDQSEISVKYNEQSETNVKWIDQ